MLHLLLLIIFSILITASTAWSELLKLYAVFSISSLAIFRRIHPEVFLVKGVLKIRSKLTGEHPSRSVIRHACSPVNLLHIFRIPFTKNTYERLFCMSSIIIESFTFFRISSLVFLILFFVFSVSKFFS